MSSTGNVRLAIIGAGRHAQAHIYSCLAYLQQVDVCAACDLDLERVQDACRRFAIPKAYAEVDEMLVNESLDAVIICINADVHAALAQSCLRCGLHVYTEKPPAPNELACREIAAVQDQSGRICMTAFKKRFTPVYQQAARLVQSEEFGKPVLLQFFRASAPYANTSTRTEYLIDSAIHALDLIHYYFGPVQRLTAERNGVSSFSVSCVFENGALASLAFTDRLGGRPWEELTLVGDGGMCIKVDNSIEMQAYKHGQACASYKPNFAAAGVNGEAEMGFVGELQHFIDCIQQDTQPDSSIASSCHTMALIDAIKRSVETQQPQAVGQALQHG